MVSPSKAEATLRFPPTRRVRTAAEYRKVFRDGQRRFLGPLVIHSCANEADQARLGMAISKRVLPRAVDRNKIKRKLRESFRHVCAELEARDIVISLSRRNRLSDMASLNTALNKLWRELKSA